MTKFLTLISLCLLLISLFLLYENNKIKGKINDILDEHSKELYSYLEINNYLSEKDTLQLLTEGLTIKKDTKLFSFKN